MRLVADPKPLNGWNLNENAWEDLEDVAHTRREDGRE